MFEKLRGIIKTTPELEDHPQYTPLFESIEQHITKSDRYTSYPSRLPFKDCPAYETLKNLPGTEKVEAVLYLAKRLNVLQDRYEVALNSTVVQREKMTVLDVASMLVKSMSSYAVINSVDNAYNIGRNLLDALMRTTIDFPQGFSFFGLFGVFFTRPKWREDKLDLCNRPFVSLVSHIEKQREKFGLDEQLKNDIQAILAIPEVSQFLNENSASSNSWQQNIRKAANKLQGLLLDTVDVAPPYPLGNGKLGKLLSADLNTLPQMLQNQWHELFHHLAIANSGKPSKKFLTTADQQIDAIGTELFRATANKWLAGIANFSLDITAPYIYDFIEAHNLVLLKGLLWAMHSFNDAQSLQLIARVTEKCYEKIPGVGPVAAGVGNAGIYTLANAEGLEGVSHLSRLKLRIRQNNTQQLIQKYIDEQAQKRGIKPAQIEELAVSDYGLLDGELTESFDNYKLVLRLMGVGESELQWLKPDGSPQKSVPAFVKADEALAAKLKTMQGLAKQVKQVSGPQRDRIDRLYVENLSWNLADFETYYLHHGLVSTLARKLIWSLDGQAALFVAGQWQNETGAPIKTSKNPQVRLWHPIDSTADTVLAWRDRLEALQIQQPFKQAYREIYLLTDAEINTRVYSNRMAAHILKQHQFSSLAALRGWKYSLLGWYDDGRYDEIAKKRVPEFGLTAQYWINEISDDFDSMNESGIWNYVATDQVRFCDQDGQAIPLLDVPPLIFSEIMRDVDLFVGVASVGNDPAWQEGGQNDYWQSYSFGELTEIAKTRKSVLERLLPRLKIRNVAKIDGKFLVVNGKRHAYKIHIGSGNILISPNDRYLCIVPSRDKDKNVDSLFLPFEGDKGLSIVLSKAFLLAEDDKIKDPTILSQL